ncbi:MULTISPECIES: HalOD1 output domain-containing protein [Halorussus]|uniref:HalOD1 output domain-containing protein n=1 Tax=Halorussus TaxID=1070314 RepID=UPI00209E3604|nr:HalOD1 output domain-containing protein [Halorussus vallis]USZ75558.1 hypothetical protein NGM07_19275 [Halorussus vallis]
MSHQNAVSVADEATPSERVVAAVAAATNRDQTDVGPLYHAIDPDALDRLFETTRQATRGVGRVEFSIAGCDVVVHGDGAVEVERTDVDSGFDRGEGRGGPTLGSVEDGGN